MTDVGELIVRIRADSTALQQGMQEASAAVRHHSDLMTEALERTRRVLENLGIALAAREIIEFGKGALESADQMDILAQRTGFAASTLSALNIPLKQNGSSVEEFANGVKFLSRNIELAAEGNQELVKRFDALGLSVTKLKTLSPEEQFDAVAKALGGVTDQGQLTADAMALMGRGAAALIPLIKETGGNVADFTDQAKALGDALTDDQIHKVHEYEDAWVSFVEHLKIKVVEGVTALDEFKRHAEAAFAADTATLYGTSAKDRLTGTVSDKFPGTVVSLEKFGPAQQKPDTSAAGGNADLLTPAGPAPDAQLAPYIQSLRDEADALGKSKLALAEYRAEKEGSAKAADDFKNGLRDTKELTDDERARIDAATDAYERQKDALADLQKQEEKHAQLVAQLESQISGSLADIALNYKSLGATVTSVLQQIAKQILEMKVTTPLVEAIGGTKSSPGLLDGLFGSLGKSFGGFFADGGSPPVGVPSIVGERGPEIFVPDTAGTIIPNGKLGGHTVVVNQSFNLNPGATEQTVAALYSLKSAIKSETMAGVFAAIQQGGSASKIVGARS